MSWIMLLLSWMVSGAALALTAAIVPGFRVRGFSTALIASLIIGVANMFVRPILIFLTLPLTVVTLGFFIFVVDAFILRICAGMLKEMEITNWISAIFGAIILMITSSVLHWMFI